MPGELESTLVELMPPWLRRTNGARLLSAIGAVIDGLYDRSVDGVALRFPEADMDANALAMLGSERRIRRGPGEPASTYAVRLLPWWSDHRARGGPYALLRQLRAYFVPMLGRAPIDVVYHSGTRRRVAQDSDDVVRDAITWGADGSARWAQVWIFFHVPDEVPYTVELETQDGDTLLTQDDEPIEVTVFDPLVGPGGVITDATAATFRAVPREWSAAHVEWTYVVLLWGVSRLWGYPTPAPTWAEWEASGATWGEHDPVVLPIEGWS